MKKTTPFALGLLALSVFTALARGEVVSNGIPAGTVGSWVVDVGNGGRTSDGTLWANRAVSGLGSDNVIFDYSAYVNTGTGGVTLDNTSIDSSVGPNGSGGAVSSGHFTGSNGNRINWTATSTIAAGSPTYVTQYAFSVDPNGGGTLGNISLYQYLDEDTFAISENVFFPRGSVGTADLELFTVHTTENVGVSQGGSQNVANGLNNASFIGWAVDNYDDMNPQLSAGTQAVSLAGVIAPGLTDFLHPVFGPTKGPADIVSVLAWTFNPNATSGSLLTTLGGVPTPGDVPQPTVPEPTAIVLGAMALLGFLGFARRVRRTA